MTATIRKIYKGKLKKNVQGYLFISLALIGFLAFRLVPMLYSLYLSFHEYDILTAPEFAGLANYIQALTRDNVFHTAVKNTFFYMLTSVPIRMIASILIALLLSQKVKGMGIYRTLFYLPAVTAGVAINLLWKWVLHPTYGPLNNVLAMFGIQGPAWLGNPDTAMWGLIMLSVWQMGPQIVLFLAGLQNIPKTYYEAAEIDGAGKISTFFKITLPLLSPVVFFNLIMVMIDSARMFTKSYVMTSGGPRNATLVWVLHLYREGFRWMRMGYASALAWLLVLVILILTIINFKISGKWVYYEGE